MKIRHITLKGLVLTLLALMLVPSAQAQKNVSLSDLFANPPKAAEQDQKPQNRAAATTQKNLSAEKITSTLFAPSKVRTRSVRLGARKAPKKIIKVLEKIRYRSFEIVSDNKSNDSKISTTSTTNERQDIQNLIKNNALPSLNMPINFAYRSAQISPQSIPALTELGKSLLSQSRQDLKILLIGHTDAKGSPEYNLALSQRRAKSVKHYLVQNFGINPQNLYTVGNGEEHLKDPENPYSGENRRVQVTNIGQYN